MVRQRMAAAAAALTALLLSACGPTATAPELYEQVRERYRNATSLSWEGTYTVSAPGVPAEQIPAPAQVTLKIARPDLIHLSTHQDEAGEMKLIAGEEWVWQSSTTEGETIVLKAPAPDSPADLAEQVATATGPGTFALDLFFDRAPDIEADNLTLAPETATVNGVKCHELSLVNEDTTIRLFIGVSDGLLHRTTTTLAVAQGAVTLTAEPTSTTLDEAIEPAAFDYTPPDGAEVFEGETLLEAMQQMALDPGLRRLIGKPAPDFTLKTIDGESIKLSSLRGKPVLLDFWATWCGPCQRIIPALQQIDAQHGDQVHVLMISSEDAEVIRKHFEGQTMTVPLLTDPGDTVAQQYHITGLPTEVFIDAEGVVRDVTVGVDPESEPYDVIWGELQALLGEAAGTEEATVAPEDSAEASAEEAPTAGE